MMKLILVRHGETEWVRQGRYQGSTDVPLNRRGLLQAKAVGKILAKERPKLIYTSQLSRARQTAQEIAERCRKVIQVDERLNELSFGSWEGFFHAKVAKQFPQAAKDWYSANWTSCPPKGESLKSLDKRISSFLGELSEDYHRSHTAIIVSHGGPIRMFLIRILKIMPSVFWRIRIDPASVSILHLTISHKELVLLNSQAHLNGLKRERRHAS